MKIGIIGAGNIGGTLSRRLVALGHDVSVANSRGPDTLSELAARTGATAVSAGEAARGKDLVIVTIPQARIPDLPDDLLPEDDGGVTAPVVVDTGNYYPRRRDGVIAAIEEGTVESAWVQQQLGHPVIKAFNNIYADHLLSEGHPPGTPKRIALPVAGDNERAKAMIMRLVDELGFDAIDAGPIAESWRQQPGTSVYTTDLDAEGVRDGLAHATRSGRWIGGRPRRVRVRMTSPADGAV